MLSLTLAFGLKVIQGTGPARHYSEAESLLLEEIITLRERVGDLQRVSSCPLLNNAA